MATLIHLCDQGLLDKYDPCLSWREQEERLVYVTPTAARWMQNDLPNAISDRNLEITPYEQVIQFLADFCAGREICFERQFRPINHIQDGIWELKTPDVRLFGWFAARDCFVATACNTKFNVMKHNLVPGYRNSGIYIRDNIELNEPKFIVGDDPQNVVSAFRYPPP